MKTTTRSSMDEDLQVFYIRRPSSLLWKKPSLLRKKTSNARTNKDLQIFYRIRPQTSIEKIQIFHRKRSPVFLRHTSSSYMTEYLNRKRPPVHLSNKTSMSSLDQNSQFCIEEDLSVVSHRSNFQVFFRRRPAGLL